MADDSGLGLERLVFHDCPTEDDYVEMVRCQDNLAIRRPFRWLVSLVVTLLAAVCSFIVVMRFIRPGRGPVTTWHSYAVGTVVMVVWTYLHFGLRAERAWQARRLYRRRLEFVRKTEVAITLTLVTVVNEDARSEFRWKLVSLVADVPAGMMFCNLNRQAIVWLPARLFEEDRSREQVRALAELNGIPVRRVV